MTSWDIWLTIGVVISWDDFPMKKQSGEDSLSVKYPILYIVVYPIRAKIQSVMPQQIAR